MKTGIKILISVALTFILIFILLSIKGGRDHDIGYPKLLVQSNVDDWQLIHTENILGSTYYIMGKFDTEERRLDSITTNSYLKKAEFRLVNVSGVVGVGFKEMSFDPSVPEFKFKLSLFGSKKTVEDDFRHVNFKVDDKPIDNDVTCRFLGLDLSPEHERSNRVRETICCGRICTFIIVP
ncbi:hypothetical protein GWK08_07140 [Leptobacterium flavescens]|uniref:Uncharacterized protein n=1 Tax=Leptobacterium flavescens TaxID=472055 RepID=A0A6P0UMV6_9FLAO|nr:hypothetical protein [Leptobacterium flavescens]NER13208.1 hypothetical protein [Leptobacterium flavescens]